MFDVPYKLPLRFHIAVTVKWGKEVFKDVELNSEESPEVFKAQLLALTNVPVERQKGNL